MNRLAICTALMLLGLVVAAVGLFTGWTVPFSAEAGIVFFGLFAASIALFGAMVIAVVQDKRWIVAHSSDAQRVLGRVSRGVRWSSLFAITLCLLLLSNCTANVTSSSIAEVSNAMLDPMRFWTLTAAVLAPLVLALLIPSVLTMVAERLATRRPQTARKLGRLAVWSMVAVVPVSLLTVGIGSFLGLSSCDFGTSAGYCAAGAGSVMNLLSVGALALFLPYAGLVTSALEPVEPGRST